jgi:tetratricopeptide (TPR) repeat protein
MLTFYDNKKHKEGLKNADKLIEKYPIHPESNAMRALLLSGLNRMPEAIDQIKKTLFKNLTNFTCWHVYGIINRKEKDYEQARKAYINALKYNPENDSVMRDLCQIQIHMRDYAGFHETRRMMLLKDSANRDIWCAFTVSCYMNEDYAKCVECVDSMLSVNVGETKKPLTPLQKMEIHTLKIRSLEHNEAYEYALKCIKQNKKAFINDLEREDTCGRLNFK